MNALKALLKDPKVRAALVALVLAVAGYFGFACSSPQLSAVQARALASHQCYIAALEPALGELAPDVLRALLAGGNPVQALAVHGLSESQIVEVLNGFSDCAVDAVVSPRPRDSGVDL